MSDRKVIYLDDVLDALNEYFARIGKLKRGGLTIEEKAIKLDTIDAIKALPPVQPERKTGKWIVHYECPKCGEITKDFTEYCPFCGADMRGEQDDS